MATQITNYQCPGCTAPLEFSPATGKLECEFCGGSYTPAEVEAFYAEKNLKAEEAARHAAETEEAASANDQWGEDASRMRAYLCPSCGAELICDDTTAATSCPYCGNPTVVPGQFADVKRPDYVIPFKVEKEAAVSALKQHYKGKPLLPGSFAKESHLEEIKGVYVPFWLYDGEASADVTFAATRSHTHTTHNERITTTEYYRVERSGRVSFEKVPVDGSTQMPDGHMDAIEPYDYEQMEPFSLSYLPGFLADKYDVSPEECAVRAEERCRNSAVIAMQSTVSGYSTCSVQHANVQINRKEPGYALLPVWLLSTKWQDKVYLFAMNGQTGKLIGDLPVSKGRLFAWFAGLFAFFATMGWMFFESEAGLIGGAVIAAVICAIMAASMKTAHRQTDAHAYIPSSGVVLTRKADYFTHRTVSRQPLNNNNQNRSGGGSGRP